MNSKIKEFYSPKQKRAEFVYKFVNKSLGQMLIDKNQRKWAKAYMSQFTYYWKNMMY